MVRRSPNPYAWIADVLCGAIGGYAVLGPYGALAGALFMATAGEMYRRRRLRREAQLRELRSRAALRRHGAERGVAALRAD
jgi:hypothetical protein